MNYLFKICLTINSILFSFIVFLVNQNKTINSWSDWFTNWPPVSSYILYITIILILNIGILWLKKFLGNDVLRSKNVISIEPANDAFLSTYLGYFFVALSVNTTGMFLFVFSIISIFMFYSRISYFNPFLFLFGFSFFYVINDKGVKLLIISKKKLKTREDADFKYLKRINDYTFIDIGDK